MSEIRRAWRQTLRPSGANELSDLGDGIVQPSSTSQESGISGPGPTGRRDGRRVMTSTSRESSSTLFETSETTVSETASTLSGSFRSLADVGGQELIMSVLSRFYTIDEGPAKEAGVDHWLAIERDLGPVRITLEEDDDSDDGQIEMSLHLDRDNDFQGDTKRAFDPLHSDTNSPLRSPIYGSHSSPESPLRSPIAALRTAMMGGGARSPLEALASPLAALKMIRSPLGSGSSPPREDAAGIGYADETIHLPSRLGERGIYHVQAIEEEDIVSVKHVKRRRSLRFKFSDGMHKHTFLSLFLPHIQRPHAHHVSYSHWPRKTEEMILKRLNLRVPNPKRSRLDGPDNHAAASSRVDEEFELGTLQRLDSGHDNMEANFKRDLEPRHFLTPVEISGEFHQGQGGMHGHEEYAAPAHAVNDAAAAQALASSEQLDAELPTNWTLSGRRARRQQVLLRSNERGVRYHSHKVDAGARSVAPGVKNRPRSVVQHSRVLRVANRKTDQPLPYELAEPTTTNKMMSGIVEEYSEGESVSDVEVKRGEGTESGPGAGELEDDKAKLERATQRAFAAEWTGLQTWWVAQYCTAQYLLSAETLVAPKREPRSLFLFSLESPWRQAAIQLTESRLWTASVFVIIIANIVVLGATNPLDTPELVAESVQRERVELASTCFNIFFILECAIMIFANGFILGKHTYLRKAANVLDFAIVLTSFLDFVSDAGGNLTALRSFRALKPLRAISRAATLRGLVQMLLKTVAYVAGALAISLGMLFVGAMLGVELFNGSLRSRCFSQSEGVLLSDQVCLPSTGPTDELSFPMGLPFLCPSSYACVRVSPNPGDMLTHFDDIGSAVYTLLQVLTLSGWSEVMHQLQDSYSPAVSMYFLFLVIIGPIQAVSFFLSIITSRLLKFREKQRQHGIRTMSKRWTRLSNILALELWHDRAEVHAVLRKRKTVKMFFVAMRQKRIGDAVFSWDLEARFRRLMKSDRGQVYRSHVLDRLTNRRLIDPMETWKYLVLQMHREVAKQLAIVVEKGAKRGTIKVDALGRPVIELDQMQKLKRKIRRAADKKDRAKAVYLEDLELYKEDVKERFRTRLQDVMQAIERVAHSTRLDTFSLFLIFLTTFAMCMEHEYDSAIGLYWASESGWIRFHAGLAYAAIGFTAMFTIEIAIKIIGLKKGFFIAPNRITLAPQLQWFNVIDMGVVIVSLVDVPTRLSEGYCLLNATSSNDCSGGGLGFAFLRMLRFLRVTRLARFLRKLPILRKQLINLILVARNVKGLLGLLLLFLSIFAILGMTLFGGRMHIPPEPGLLGIGVEGYCDIPWEPVKSSSAALGRPCRIVDVDLDNHPSRPYKINIVTGFSRINEVLSTHWAADPSTAGPEFVTIIGVVPRENFDTFFSALVTVFVLWTQPNWSGTINPLYREVGPFVSLYFYLMIFVGNFLLQNLLFAAIIVEFRDRNNVNYIQAQRKKWQQQDERREKLGDVIGKKQIAEEAGEAAKIEKIGDEENEMTFIVANTTEEGPGKQNIVGRKLGEFGATIRLANFVAFHPYFERFMALMILMSIVMLAVDVPSYTGGRITVEFMITVLNFTFILECTLKVIARGWIQYVTSPADFLDLVIVSAIIAEEASNIAFLQGIWRQIRPEKERVDYGEGFSESVREKVLSSMRILRVVRLFKYFRRLTQNLRQRALTVALDALHHAARPLLNTCLVAFTLFSLFGILGMQAFAGNFRYCSDLRYHTRQACEAPAAEGEPEREWLNADFNFDWFGAALLSCFVIASRDGWEDIMWRGVDITSDPTTGPRWYNNLPALLFFLPLQVVSLLFIVKIFLAVFVDVYQSVSAATPFRAPVKILRSRLPMWAIEDSPVGEARARMQKLINSTMMDLIISAFVILNIGFMAISSFRPSSAQVTIGTTTDMFFGAVFAFEASMKLAIGSPRLYFRNPWNRFDFALVVAHFVGVSLSYGQDLNTISPTFLRSFRVVKLIRLLRILRAVRIFKLLSSLHTVVEVLGETLSTVSALLLLVMLLTFLTAVIGKKLFGDMCQEGDELMEGTFGIRCLLLDPVDLLPRHVGFRHILDGMTTLSVIATLDGWTAKMQRFKLDAGRRPEGHIDHAIAALRQYLAAPNSEDGRLALATARNQFPGCITSFEISALQAEGLVLCGEPGQEVACGGTCAQLASANALFTVFIVLSNYILLHLVVAAMIEALKDPVQKAMESKRRVTEKLPLKVFKLVVRRWRARAVQIAPYEERWARDRMLHQQQRLAAHHQRSEIARRVRLQRTAAESRSEAQPKRAHRQGTMSPPVFTEQRHGHRPSVMDVASSHSMSLTEFAPAQDDDVESLDGVRLRRVYRSGPRAQLAPQRMLPNEPANAAEESDQPRLVGLPSNHSASSSVDGAEGEPEPGQVVHGGGENWRKRKARVRMRRIEARLSYLQQLDADERGRVQSFTVPHSLQETASGAHDNDRSEQEHSRQDEAPTDSKSGEGVPKSQAVETQQSAAKDGVDAKVESGAARQYKVKHRFIARRHRASTTVLASEDNPPTRPPRSPMQSAATSSANGATGAGAAQTAPGPHEPEQQTMTARREDDQILHPNFSLSTTVANDTASSGRSRRRGGGREQRAKSVQADLVLTQNVNLPFFL